LIASSASLLLFKPANAQSIPKPSVPEFTVKFVDRSYDVPITSHTTIDPFTGKQVTTTSGGNHVTNKNIDITIKNTPYPTIDLNNGSVIQLYYAVRTKGHFADWTPEASSGYSFTRVLASSSDHTVVTLRIGSSDNDILMDYADVVIRAGGQEDFQVNAQVGYNYLYHGGHILPLYTDFAQFTESGWSNTQTITIPEGLVSTPAPNPTENPSPSPTVPEFSWLTILPLMLAIPIVLIMIRNRLTCRSSNRILILESNHKGCRRRIPKSRYNR
jgi:hypothetical protein